MKDHMSPTADCVKQTITSSRINQLKKTTNIFAESTVIYVKNINNVTLLMKLHIFQFEKAECSYTTQDYELWWDINYLWHRQ